MPSIYGKYSLTEVAGMLNVTPAFINRIQRETGIGGSIGGKGHATSFTEFDLKVFRRIKVLRKNEISFKEIKEIWKIENNLLGLNDGLTEKKYPTLSKWSNMALVIHERSVKWPPPEMFSKGEDKDMNEYVDEVGKLLEVAEELKRRRDVFFKETEEVNRVLKSLNWDKA